MLLATNVLEAQYDNVCLIMRRLKSDRHLTDERKSTPSGVIN